eukprot:s3086_g1.t1
MFAAPAYSKATLASLCQPQWCDATQRLHLQVPVLRAAPRGARGLCSGVAGLAATVGSVWWVSRLRRAAKPLLSRCSFLASHPLIVPRSPAWRPISCRAAGQMQPQCGVCGTPASILPVADGRAEGILVYRERHKDAEIQVNAGGHLQSAVVLRPLEFDFMLFNRWVIGVDLPLMAVPGP